MAVGEPVRGSRVRTTRRGSACQRGAITRSAQCVRNEPLHWPAANGVFCQRRLALAAAGSERPSLAGLADCRCEWNPQSKAEPFLAWPRVTGVNGINFPRYAGRVQGLPLCGERGEPTPATPPTPANYDSGAECTLAS